MNVNTVNSRKLIFIEGVYDLYKNTQLKILLLFLNEEVEEKYIFFFRLKFLLKTLSTQKLK